jgi:hypothetical protein
MRLRELMILPKIAAKRCQTKIRSDAEFMWTRDFSGLATARFAWIGKLLPGETIGLQTLQEIPLMADLATGQQWNRRDVLSLLLSLERLNQTKYLIIKHLEARGVEPL